jgi:PKD repeat protein
MKTNTLRFIRQAILLLGAFFMITFISCKEDEPAPDPIASFQYAISETNFLEVIFTNYSQNAVSYTWTFGDGQTSTDENPAHIYEAAGSYEVVLTAKNKDGVTHSFSETILITDPYVALRLLTGDVSKTWKLFREGTSMSLGESAENPANWWEGLQNNGARPCLYMHEFTFHFNGTYVFNDNGVFWGEYGVFNGQWNYEKCFEATSENMINKDGVNVSDWLSGTHAFTYDASAGTATLTGLGAWIGIPKLGTTGETTVPVASVTFKLSITQETGYDLMTVAFDWGAAGYWKIVYVSYSDPSLEPDIVTEEEEWGENLENITPTALSHTFESETSFELLGTISGASIITPGVDDPADATATKVGKFERTDAQYQEAILRVHPEPKDIIFTNFTKVSIDVYLPSSNTYEPLTKKVIIGFADQSQTQQWWNGLIQYESDEIALGEWVTVTFNLDSPSYSSTAGQTPFDREDLDMIFVQIGGGGHTSTGTFYVRNLIFE